MPAFEQQSANVNASIGGLTHWPTLVSRRAYAVAAEDKRGAAAGESSGVANIDDFVGACSSPAFTLLRTRVHTTERVGRPPAGAPKNPSR